MRTLVIERVDLREKFARMMGDFDLLKGLIQTQSVFGGLLSLGADRVQADDASVFLLNAAEEHLEVVLDRRAERQAFVGFRQPVGKGIVSMVVWNEHGISLSNVHEHEMFDGTADRTFHYTTRSMIALPLLVNGRVLGVLSAVNKRGADQFSDDDMNELVIIASSIGHLLRSQILERLVQL
jgi:signal transduction protein with GAF and PtsI domain